MVFEKLKNIFCDYFEIDEEYVVPEASLVSDFSFDELDFADLCMDIEDLFGFEVIEEDIEKIVTVADLVKYIEENIR